MTIFNNKTISLAIAATLTLSVSATAIAATSGKIAKPTVEQAAIANAINFSFSIAQDHKLQLTNQSVTTKSDEYFFTVNGSQLNKGVDIHTSEKGALIKISRQGDKGKALESGAMQLRSANQPKQAVASKVIGESDLASTGVFSNAMAVKLGDAVAPGEFKLSYNQVLPAKNLYVIHVKEKQAANKLEISAASQHYLQGQNFSFDALMLANNDTLEIKQVNAFIMSPSGKKFATTIKQTASGVAQISAAKAALEVDAIEAPINGFYELHVNAVADDNGQTVRRTGKIAFALAPDTADLGKSVILPINKFKPVANIGLTVKVAGRFEARGILYGHDSNGKLKPIMETHSAQNFAQGKQVINMQFDRNILAKSALKAPYVVQNIRLYDQSRMSRQ